MANGPAIVAEERGGLLDVTVEQLADNRPADAPRPRQESPLAPGDATNVVAEAIPAARVEWVGGGHLIDPAHPAVLAFVDEVLAGN